MLYGKSYDITLKKYSWVKWKLELSIFVISAYFSIW